MTEQEVTKALGAPFAVHTCKDGIVQYEYIERIIVGGESKEERHYFLLFRDGKLIEKRLKIVTPWPWQENSYDLQTT
jgi:hypothetical protein